MLTRRSLFRRAAAAGAVAAATPGLIHAGITGNHVASVAPIPAPPVPAPLLECFNCRQMTPPSKWLPRGFEIPYNRVPPQGIVQHRWETTPPDSNAMCNARVRYWLHLCDPCLRAIANCATCGRALREHEGGLRISRASEGLAFLAWPVVSDTTAYPVPGGIAYIGVRPCSRDLIVADCPKCFVAKKMVREDCPTRRREAIGFPTDYSPEEERRMLYGDGSATPIPLGTLDFSGLLEYKP